jgi:Mg2+ and Co2+ transporter CorA
MATKNMRIVGYLPPPLHQKLREYMKEQSLTESAALVKIVKQFFDGSTGTKVPEAAREKDTALADLRADIAELKQRLMVLEQAVVGKQRPFRSKTSQKQRPQTILPPQSGADLARRLGVSPDTIEEAYQKGEAYFKDWSRRMDPTKRSWHKRGELFHPESD